MGRIALSILYPLIGLVAGIYISNEWMPGFSLPLICIGLCVLVWLVLNILLKKPFGSLRFSKLHLIWIIFLFAGIGSLDFETRCRPVLKLDETSNLVFNRGIVISANSKTDGDIFKLKLISCESETGEPVNFRNIKILLKTDGLCAHPGDILEFYGKPVCLNPSSLYDKRLIHEGISYKIAQKWDNIRIKDSKPSIFYSFLHIRDNLSIKIEKSSLSNEAKGFLISLLLGDKSFLSKNNRATLNSAGLGHMLALSGLHVGILYLILYYLLFPLSLAGYPNLHKIAVILMIWGYVLFTGVSPSTVRAAIMATLLVVAYMVQRKNSAVNSLFVAIFIILIIDPYSLWNIGLQLSFISVASILFFSERLNPFNRHFHNQWFNISATILISLIATISTSMLTAYYFGSLPLLFLPSNLILLPLLPFFIGATLIYLVPLVFGFDMTWLAKILSVFQDFFVKASGLLSANGKYTFNLNVDEKIVIFWLLAILSFSIALYSTRKHWKRLSTLTGFVLIAVVFAMVLRFEEEPSIRLSFKHSFTKMTANIIRGGNSFNLTFPRRTISRTAFDDTEIIAIDNAIHPDSLESIRFGNNDLKRFLIVGSKADMSQISMLAEEGSFERIILHSNIGSKMTAGIIENVKPENREKIYSLRENGSLEVDL